MILRSGAALALAGAGLALYNRATLRPLARGTTDLPVTVCIPARNEAQRLPALIADLRAQVGVPSMRVLILDDQSTDETASVVLGDPRFEMHRGSGPPPGWIGKSAACRRLSELAGPGVLVFLDADVRLRPEAIASAVAELQRSGAALLSPWPRQVAGTPAERLVQPLLCWSWATTLPVRVANRSLRPSTAVACGQFLVFDRAAYDAIGGHAAVAADVTEDLGIARALRRAGFRTHVVPAGDLASCRMYSGAGELADGYARWLWSVHPGVSALLVLAYLVPPVAALFGSRWGAAGYAGAVVSRLAARSLETRAAPDILDALAHPLSVSAYVALSVRSRRRRGSLTWRGRALTG